MTSADKWIHIVQFLKVFYYNRIIFLVNNCLRIMVLSSILGHIRTNPFENQEEPKQLRIPFSITKPKTESLLKKVHFC